MPRKERVRFNGQNYEAANWVDYDVLLGQNGKWFAAVA